MSIILSEDADFRVFRISFDELVEIQLEAESHRLATRWTSVEALCGQVEEEDVILHSLMRESRGGVVRSYRCLMLFSNVDEGLSGGLATIDLVPERFESLERIDRDPVVRKAIVRMFALAAGGIAMVSKN